MPDPLSKIEIFSIVPPVFTFLRKTKTIELRYNHTFHLDVQILG